MMPDNREYYDEKALDTFDSEIYEDLIAKLEEIREDLMIHHGFYFNYEDVYLPRHNEKIINIY